MVDRLMALRSVRVLWLLSRLGHASERRLSKSLREQGWSVKNRQELRRVVQLLCERGLARHDVEAFEYVFIPRASKRVAKEEKVLLQQHVRLWREIDASGDWEELLAMFGFVESD